MTVAQPTQSGRISLGSLVLFLAYLSSLTAPVHALAGLSGTLARAAASRERLGEVFAIEPVTSAATAASPAPLDTSTARARIDLDHVTVFGHGARHRARGVTFHVDPGEFVCLTGPSGAGKTTASSRKPQTARSTSASPPRLRPARTRRRS